MSVFDRDIWRGVSRIGENWSVVDYIIHEMGIKDETVFQEVL